ncbi:MAG: hypothetical protein ACJ8KU_05985 [Chthoniobacterales bacterium]
MSMQRDDDQQLWDLLGKSAAPQVSPFFARNVVREIRQQESRPSRETWFSIRKLLPVASCAAVVIAAALVVRGPVAKHAPSATPILAHVEVDDSDVAADLDDVVGADDDDDTAIL